MADLPVPQAEAKPSIVPMSVFRAARDWAEVHGHQSPDDRLVALVFAAGRAQAAVDLLGQIPRETDEIIEWLQSHNLGLGAGPGAVLSSLRFDMDALVASWAATEGGGGEDHPKDATATG